MTTYTGQAYNPNTNTAHYTKKYTTYKQAHDAAEKLAQRKYGKDNSCHITVSPSDES